MIVGNHYKCSLYCFHHCWKLYQLLKIGKIFILITAELQIARKFVLSLYVVLYICRKFVQSLCLLTQVNFQTHNWKLVKFFAKIVRSYELDVQEKIRIRSFGSVKDVGFLNGMTIRRAMNLMTSKGWRIEIWMRVKLTFY